MPTAKQLQNAKTKLKKTTKPTGNKPTIPTAALLRLIAADPRIKRNREFMKQVHELTKRK
jgi:hypothetical protein